MATTLVIPDIHAPFVHGDALEFLEEVADNYQPDEVVQIGDLIDVHAVSRHDKDPDGFSAGDELDRAIDFLGNLAKIFPEMKIVKGNHDERFHKMAFKHGLPRKVMKDFEEIIEAPKGWEMFHDGIIIDEVMYEHGTPYTGLYPHINAVKNNMRSTVIGHLHAVFGVHYLANRDKLLFGVAAGCLVDRHSYAMAYGDAYPRKPILGCVVIEDGTIVRMVPMLLDSDGNWIGAI